MTGKIETREFSIEDYQAAVELWKKVEGVEIAEGDSRDEIAQYLSRNPGLSRLAFVSRSTTEPAGAGRRGRESPRGLMSREANQSIVGIALCGHDGRRGYIYHLAVDPNFQRRGLGKRLLDECLQGLRGAGVTRVLVMVAKDNPRGRDFWRRNGWEELDGATGMGINL